MPILNSIRRFTRKISGIDFDRYNALNDGFLRTSAILDALNICTVLDVGANDGGFASELFEAGFKGEILSFEPLPDAHALLTRRSSGGVWRWRIAEPMALSDKDGVAAFHVSGNSVSSSLLPMMDTHVAAAPQSAKTGEIRVPTKRLDNLWPSLQLTGPVFLKIDTQGSERMVLDGAGALLSGPIAGIQLEMSTMPLYADQILAPELDAHLRGLGFALWDILPGFRDPQSLRMLQYDGIYFRIAQ